MRQHVFAVAIFAFALTTLSFAAIDNNAKALAALDDEWSKAAAAGNVDAVVSYYADDAIAYPPNEPAVSGRAALKGAWAKMLADPKAKLTWKTQNASIDRNLGYTSGTYQVSDGSSVLEKGKYLCVWRKGADGKWKAIHDMWNSDAK